jgi:predicted dinucleotide-binding enzyme
VFATGLKLGAHFPLHPTGKRAFMFNEEVRAKDLAAMLIRDVGFDPVDAGPLRIARYVEPFSLLMGQLAYEGDEGPEIAYRLERFEQ